MLHEFLADNEHELIERCRIKAARRPPPKVSDEALQNGIPIFLGQLIQILRLEQTGPPVNSNEPTPPNRDGANAQANSDMGKSATLHGVELLLHGFTIDQVVHAYGDLCQAITETAIDHGEPFQVDEFKTLNRCLDDAIAGAVTEFSLQRDVLISDIQVTQLNERLGFLAHELRNLIQTATLAFAAVKTGKVGVDGSTGRVLDRTLVALRNLVDRSLAEVRMTAGMAVLNSPFFLSEFMAEMRISAELEAQHKGVVLRFSEVEPDLAVNADRDLLSSAIGNLLQNAYKFTRPGSEVSLKCCAAGDRVLIEVADNCGGLPVGDVENLFRPFRQVGKDRTGLGLGLSIARKNVEANNGFLRVRDKPGVGCSFTIDLPRRSLV